MPYTFLSATGPQLQFIDSLLGTREVPEGWRTKIARLRDDGLERTKASEIISALTKCPKHEQAPDALWPEVPAGRYAIDHNDGLKFFRVDRPTEGRWAGYVFVKRQASDELYNVRDRRERNIILAKIARDPAAASRRYGQELGACGICGRTLTNEVSRAIGIGPVCAGRTGWADADEIALMRESGQQDEED